MLFRRLLLMLLCLGFGLGGVIRAQDAVAPEVTEQPTDVPTEQPTEAPTVQPTEVATDIATDVPTEQPTEAPTEIPTDTATEQPTDVPTDVPTEQPTEETTQEPNSPPKFSLDGSVAFDATAGLATTFTLAVADEAGLVTVGRADSAGASPSTITVTQAAEAVAAETGFYTAVSIDYTAPADFSGTDNFTLVAVDAEGLSATLTLTVNVVLAEATLEPTPEPTSIPDQIRIINYNPAASEASIQAMLATLGAIEVSRIPQIGAMKVQIPQAVSDTASVTAALAANVTALSAGVVTVEPDIVYHLDFTPNDPYYFPGTSAPTSKQWGLNGSPYSIFAGGLNGAWELSKKDGTGVIVAVIDSGIDTANPDLAGKLLPGWDFINDDKNTDDDNSHGTHVAGVIAANTNNAKGIAGIAYNAKLLPVKVCDAAGGCPTYDIAAGLVFAADKGAKIANMSLGGGTISTTVQGAVQYAISRNVTIVAAAGNTGGTAYEYPASYPGVISVAAHDINGQHASFSTANDRVTISAPGVAIVSTIPIEFDTCDGLKDGYSNFSYNPHILPPACVDWDGTSMATPHVTGVIALMISDNVATTPAQTKAAIICSAADVGPANTAGVGRDNQFGYGYLEGDWAQTWRNNNLSVCKVTAPNDLFQNATKITTVPYTNVQGIDSRGTSSSPSDPSACNVTNQSVWYQIKPTVSDSYQISTFGSSYDTMLSVWQMPEEGNPSTNLIGCNDDATGFSYNSLLNVPLTAGQIYYIQVNSLGTANDQILSLDVRRSLIANNVDVQETSPSIAYSGSWVQTAVTGASGGQVKMTSDDSATAAFVMRGYNLELSRSVGPTFGNLEIWVDGSLFQTLVNRAAVLKRNQSITYELGGNAGQWHQIVLRRAAGGPAGPIDIDRIKTSEPASVPTAAITALTDDSLGSAVPCATKKFCYVGAFSVLSVPGANLGKVNHTTAAGASVTFRATGTNITIFRSTAPGYGTMDVYVDNVLVGNDVSNASTTPHVKVPYVVSGLGAYSHVVRIVNNAGSTLDFDAASASSPAALAASTTKTNENSTALMYGGYWTNVTEASALGRTTRQSNEVGSTVNFRFNGNWVCIVYAERFGVTGSAQIFQDGVPAAQPLIATGASTSFNHQWCSPNILSDRIHTVQLRVTSGTIEIDGVWARRQVVITPSMGIVQENNAAMTYVGNWTPFAKLSGGGYAFQGGSARTTSNDGDSVSFYINGTGFILYTSLATWNSGWQVYVDGSATPLNFTFQDVPYNYIDTWDDRFRPYAIAVIANPALTPGIHSIRLVKWDSGSAVPDFVDFDGIRVFP